MMRVYSCAGHTRAEATRACAATTCATAAGAALAARAATACAATAGAAAAGAAFAAAAAGAAAAAAGAAGCDQCEAQKSTENNKSRLFHEDSLDRLENRVSARGVRATGKNGAGLWIFRVRRPVSRHITPGLQLTTSI